MRILEFSSTQDLIWPTCGETGLPNSAHNCFGFHDVHALQRPSREQILYLGFLSQDCNNLGFFYMNCLSLTRTTSLSLISLKSKENKTSKNKEHDIKGRH